MGRNQGLRQIPKNHPAPRFVPGDHLVKINLIVKSFQRLARRRGGGDFERGAQMDFADFDAIVNQAGQGVLRFLKFHGKMTGVVIDPQMFGQAFVAGMLRPKMIEKMHRFRRAFQQT